MKNMIILFLALISPMAISSGLYTFEELAHFSSQVRDFYLKDQMNKVSQIFLSKCPPQKSFPVYPKVNRPKAVSDFFDICRSVSMALFFKGESEGLKDLEVLM